MVKSGSYHFGGGPSHDAKDEMKLDALFSKLSDCTGVSYDDLSRDCLRLKVIDHVMILFILN